MKDKFSPGDLVRMCTYAEADSVHRGHVDWCYGIYLRREVDNVSRPHGWISRYNNLILCESRIQSFDHYWHIERIS